MRLDENAASDRVTIGLGHGIYRAKDQEEVGRRHEGRDADRGSRTRSAGCENIRTRDLKMSEALMFAEKEQASGRESNRSDAVRMQ